eukprot:CAMPEP_0178466598 /NCGR_PEP_ID=MMETSP0689_2-20121128/51987_1 /TAXON_ID=160604 /ORGANISM="Amphidinium massartii, Strain CS-259" /LENGTH=94 /DNA_ID=CAMNT_0020093629 /DNA_START=851 /DNA_END=1132 /DNA_ORIENTATION=-
MAAALKAVLATQRAPPGEASAAQLSVLTGPRCTASKLNGDSASQYINTPLHGLLCGCNSAQEAHHSKDDKDEGLRIGFFPIHCSSNGGCLSKQL